MKLPASSISFALLLLAISHEPLIAQTLHVGHPRIFPDPSRFVFQTSWRSFETSTQSVARWPYGARVADVDGNGHPDVVTANWWAFHKVGILLNSGDGRLRAPTFLNCSLGALDVAIADFTGDGIPDIVADNFGSWGEGSTISLFRGTGGGSFAPQQLFTVGNGSFPGPAGLAAADFDGDGRMDLAVAMYGIEGAGSTVAVLLNNGAGGFQAVTSYPAGSAPYKLAVGDLNGDGRPDLVVARNQSKLAVLMNTGSGFAAPVLRDVLSYYNTDAYPCVELVDVDRDGDLDVVYSSGMTAVGFQNAVAVMRNQGNGTLSPAEPLFTILDQGGAIDLATGDVDGDGWPDILAATYTLWTLFRGDGHGGFLGAEVFGATEKPVAIELADMDGDGRLDPVVVGRESLEAAVYHNPGNGDFSTPLVVHAVPNSAMPSDARGMDVGDVDGDGKFDVALSYSRVSSYAGGISILLGAGSGGFSTPIDYPSPKAAIYVKLADLDGDGRPDLLWADDAPPYDAETRMNLGNGSFGPITTWAMNTCGNGEVAAIDVDNDGDLDIVLCEYAGCMGGPPDNGKRVFIRKNNGDGTFQSPYVHDMSGFPERIRGADVNGDGRIDLLATGNSWIDVSLGNGDGTFQPPVPAACDWGPKGFDIADFDHDGVLDLATTNFGDLGSGGESVSILRGRGDGTFRSPQTLAASYSATLGGVRDIVVGDANGDGDLDLMASNYGSLGVSWYENLGGGRFAPQVRYGTGWPVLGLAFRDFTGDGRGDLLTHVSYGVSLSFQPALVLLRTR